MTDHRSDRHRRRGAHADGRLSRRLEGCAGARARRARDFGRGRAGGIAADSVDEILMGCVLPAGQGQAPARQAAIGAGLPLAAGATTINKMCGSGMKAAMVAHDLLRAGSADVVVAGGMESMSNAPYLLDRARSGYRMGHGRIARSHVPRRPRGRLRQGAAHGDLRRGLRGGLPVHTQRAGRLCAHLARARQPRDRERRFRLGDRAGQREGGQVRDACRDRRAAAQGEARQDPDAQARVPRRRHGDGRQFELDLRRRARRSS